MKKLIVAVLLFSTTGFAAEAPPPPTTRELELTKIIYEEQRRNMDISYQLLEYKIKAVVEELEKRAAAEKAKEAK